MTDAGDVMALDCKLNFDDNAMFRHSDIAALLDPQEEDPNELRAGKSGLSYVQLDGDIACLVNGAGLAMSTMDLIKYHGGEPANFLDVGGGANKDQVLEAFRILLSTPNVKAVLVNIFGGIMKCDNHRRRPARRLRRDRFPRPARRPPRRDQRRRREAHARTVRPRHHHRLGPDGRGAEGRGGGEGGGVIEAAGMHVDQDFSTVM